MPRRLLAIDLDGTLLRPPGIAAGATLAGAMDSAWPESLPADAMDPRDRAAIQMARRAGVLVTLATGRMIRGALPVARALALDVPLVCADGAALACPRTGALLAGADLDPAVRASPHGHDKGTGLACLAARLGVARAQVAAVGDWWNDLAMFAWAGRSFAMGHAPPAVQAAATDVLVSTAETGGGVAEAIARWLGQ